MMATLYIKNEDFKHSAVNTLRTNLNFPILWLILVISDYILLFKSQFGKDTQDSWCQTKFNKWITNLKHDSELMWVKIQKLQSKIE